MYRIKITVNKKSDCHRLTAFTMIWRKTIGCTSFLASIGTLESSFLLTVKLNKKLYNRLKRSRGDLVLFLVSFKINI